MGPKSNDWTLDPSKRRGRFRYRERQGEGPMKMRLKIGWVQLQAKQYLRSPETGRSKEWFSPELSARAWPCPYLDNQSSSLRNYEKIICSCFRLLSFWYFDTAALGNYETEASENLWFNKLKSWWRKRIRCLAPQEHTAPTDRTLEAWAWHFSLHD